MCKISINASLKNLVILDHLLVKIVFHVGQVKRAGRVSLAGGSLPQKDEREKRNHFKFIFLSLMNILSQNVVKELFFPVCVAGYHLNARIFVF